MYKHEVVSRTLSNKSNIWLVGMKAMDARVIRNYIHLVKNLNEHFKLVDDERCEDADIVFVNVDSKEACEEFKAYIRKSRVHPILVKCSSNKAGSDKADCLVQPVTRKAIESLLNGITSTKDKSYIQTKPKLNDQIGFSDFKVLVVDDSFPVRKYMEEKLPQLTKNISKKIVLKLDFASSGKEAVNIVRKEKGAYDVVFLDVVMDDVDGYKICKWIKGAKESIQVIMLTSKSSTFDKVRGKIAGCNSYLAKPPSDEELQAVLLKAIGTNFINDETQTKQLKSGN